MFIKRFLEICARDCYKMFADNVHKTFYNNVSEKFSWKHLVKRFSVCFETTHFTCPDSTLNAMFFRTLLIVRLLDSVPCLDNIFVKRLEWNMGNSFSVLYYR